MDIRTITDGLQFPEGPVACADGRQAQRKEQRESMEHIARGLGRQGRLHDLTPAQAAAALHLITSVESFMELRRNAGMSLVATKKVLMALAEGLVDLS